jgi:3-oxoacyl-[acyl-carrier protein] reductase
MKEAGIHALVTGAGTGIGRATAKRLAKRGDKVAVHYRSHRKEAEALVKEIISSGGEAFAIGADLTVEDEVERLAQEISSRFPSLEVLVHNAGEYPRRFVEELDGTKFLSTIQTNLVAPYVLTRELLPLLKKAKWGRVVFVGSILAYNGSAHGADYAASKSGLLGLAKSLAREFSPKVTVNVVAPGTIDTAILAGDTPQMRAAREKTIPIGRIGTPEDVAEAIAFLASRDASYLTGTTVHVNGGLRMD